MTYQRISLTSLLLLLVCGFSWATDGPTDTGVLNFYAGAGGLKGSTLKTALYGIINPNGKVGSYDDLWESYKKTDVTSDGYIWDMYSNTTEYTPGGSCQGANYSAEGDSYNREHSVPQSWFNEQNPMKSDLFQVVPTDGYINNMRGSYILCNVEKVDKTSNNSFSKLGTCTINGSTYTVFEPNDVYKGDFARIYFYMITAYEAAATNWKAINGSSSVEIFQSNNEYRPLKDWYMEILMEWAKNDPVSQKEIDRNNAAYKIQGNRNPFVDYPGLEDLIWGDNTSTALDLENYTNPYNNGSSGGGSGNTGSDSGSYVYEKVTSTDQLVSGKKYLIVYEKGNCAMGSDAGNYRNSASVTISGSKITLSSTNSSHTYTLGGTTGAWTFYDNKDGVYLALTKNENYLSSSTSASSSNEKWTISVGTKTTIKNNSYTNRFIQYNSSSPRFACYQTTSNQQDVTLYVQQEEASTEPVDCGLAFSSSSASATYGEEFTEPTLTNPHGVTVSYSSSSTSVATVGASTGKVTLIKPGTTTITATFAGNSSYNSGSASYTLTVNKGKANLAYSVSTASVNVGSDFTAPTLSNSNALSPITYNSSNEDVATIDGNGNVTILSAGTTTISASFAGNDCFESGSTSYTLTVNKEEPVGEYYFSETFAKCDGTGGNDNNWNGSISSKNISSKSDSYTDNKGWKISNGYKAKECLKMGSASAKGSAKTPAIKGMNGKNLTLYFKAGAWNGTNESTTLNISGTGCNLSPSSVTLAKGKWTTYEITVTGTADEAYITFAANSTSNNRFFLDEVNIPNPNAKEKGDINGDEEFSIEDVVMLVEIVLGNANDKYGNADVNSDGTVDSEDVEALVNILLNQK